ncbi:MAG TPA: Ig-like domain-containing protein [Myxococcales bacterium]|nr:Ig-like domain-containing protein [Myxococcales bacterium]
MTPPSISTQPSNQTVDDGQHASFSVTVAGTSPAFQWRKNGADIAGATSSSYTLVAATLADNGTKFSVVAANSAGSVVSSDATLTVHPVAPSIVTQPANVTVSEGLPATFSVVAKGSAPLAYQWMRGGANISGATSSSYALAQVAAADDGALFSVSVTNAEGSVTSHSAMLSVVQQAPQITTPPQDATVNEGQPATFTVVATGSGLEYQWSRNAVAIAGATGSTFTTAATIAADEGSTFAVVVSNGGGHVAAGPALLHVHARPRITAQPADKSVIEGQSATFSVTASGFRTLSYQWRRGGTEIAGATGASYTINAAAFTDDGAQFDAVVTNSVSSATSIAATLHVSPAAPHITQQPSATTVNEGQPAVFSVVATSSVPISYQWHKNGTAIAGATLASYTTPVTTFADDGGVYSVVVSNSVGGASTTSANARLTVNFAPRITTQPHDATVNETHTATFTVTAIGTAPLAYHWSENNGTAIDGATSASYTTSPVTAADDGSTFSVSVRNALGAVSSSNATLHVIVNHPPVPSAPPIVIADPPSGTSQVAANDPDSGQTHGYSISTMPQHGTAGVSTGGLVTYTPATGFFGSDSLMVTVTDDGIPPKSGSVTIPITVQHALELTVIANPQPVASGGIVTYRMLVSNHGSTTVSGVTVSDVTQTNFSSAAIVAGTGSCSSKTCSFPAFSVAPGKSQALGVALVASGSSGSTIHSDITVTAGSGLFTQGIDVPIAPTTLTVSMTEDENPVAANGTLSYEVIVANTAAQALPVDDGGTLVVAIPAGTSFVSASNGGTFANGGIEWDFGFVDTGSVRRFFFTLSVGALADATMLPAVAQVVDQGAAIAQASTATEVQSASPLALAVSTNANPAVSGDLLNYEYRISNTGSTALNNVTLTDIAMTNYSAAVVPGSGGCGGIFSSVDQRLCKFTISSIGAGQTLTLVTSRQISGSSGALLHNEVLMSFSSGTLSRGVNVAIEPSAGLSLRIDEDHDPVLPGDALTYQLIVGNVASQALPASGNGFVTASVPAGATFVSASNGGTFASGIVTWTLGAVDPKSVRRLSYTVSVASGLVAATVLPATAQLLHGDEVEVRAETSTEVRAAIPLGLTVSANADPAVSGDHITWEYRISNPGSSSVTGVVLTDLALANFAGAVVPGIGGCGGVYSSVDQRLCTLNISAIPAGQTVTVGVSRQISGSAGATLHNDISVSFSGGMLTRGVDVAIEASAGLSLRIDEDHDPVLPGDALIYQVIVGNVASQALPASGSGFVTATVPAGTTFVSATGGGSFANGVVTWNLGSVDPKSVRRYSYTVAVGPGTAAETILPAVAQVLDGDEVEVRAEASTEVRASIPLALTVSTNSDPAVSGDYVTYEYRISNQGSSSISGVVLTDLALTNFSGTVVPGHGGCGGVFSSVDQRLCTLNFSTIPAGQTGTMVVSRQISGSAGALLHNDVSVSFPGGLLTRAIDVAIQPSAALSLRIDEDHDPALPGDALTYQVILGNVASQALPASGSGFVTASLPANATFVSASNGGAFAGGLVTWNVGSVDPHAVRRLSYTVAVNGGLSPATMLPVTAQLLDGSAPIVRAQTSTEIRPSSPVSLTVSANTDPALSGDIVTYEYRVSNLGATNLSNVIVADLAFMNFNGAVIPGVGGCGGVFSSVDQRLCSQTISSLPAGQTATLLVDRVISGTAGAQLHSDVTVSFSGGTVTQGIDVNIAQSAGLNLHIEEDHDPVLAGDLLTYEIALGNVASQALPASGTGMLTAAIPAGTTFVSANNSGTAANGLVSWSFGSVAPGGNQRYVYKVSLGALAPATALRGTAQLFDGNQLVQRAQTSSAVIAALPLRLGLAVNADPVLSGDIVTYEYRITNLGSTTLSGLVLSDLAMTNYSGATVPGSTGSSGCGGVFSSVDQRLCSIPISSIGAGKTATVLVNRGVSAHPGAMLHNDVYVAYPGGLLNRGFDLPILAAAGPSLRIEGDHDPVLPGDNVIYSVVLSNPTVAAIPAAGDGELTVALPADASFVSASSGGSESGGIVRWSFGSLGPGSTLAFSLEANVPADVPSGDLLIADAEAFSGNASLVRAAAAAEVQTASPVTLAISQAPNPVAPNGVATYTLRITNNGATTLTGIAVSELTLANFNHVTLGGAPANCPGLFSSVDGRLCDWQPLTLTAGQSQTLTLALTATGGDGTLLHTDFFLGYPGGEATRSGDIVIHH